jgi:hypothetical protein
MSGGLRLQGGPQQGQGAGRKRGLFGVARGAQRDDRGQHAVADIAGGGLVLDEAAHGRQLPAGRTGQGEFKTAQRGVGRGFHQLPNHQQLVGGDRGHNPPPDQPAPGRVNHVANEVKTFRNHMFLRLENQRRKVAEPASRRRLSKTDEMLG